MPDLDIKEAATRKLGPLPTWGWGIAIVGAVVVYKLIGGRGGSSSGSGGLAGVDAGIPSTGDDGGILDGPNSLWSQIQEQLTEQGSQLTEQGVTITEQGGLLTAQGGTIAEQQSALEAAQTALENALAALQQEQATNQTQAGLIGGLTDQIGSLGGFQALQTKLIAALNQRASLLSARNTLQTNLNTYRDALAKCRTAACRTKQNKNIANATKGLTDNATAIGAINKVIADLQKLLSGQNAAIPPRPTPIVSGR